MPPHCDSLDGPVVGAARRALDTANVNVLLPFVHRDGEGAPFTGLKPAGLDVGPVIPVAENAIETGSSDRLERLLVAVVREEIDHRFHRMIELKRHADSSVAQAREYVQAMLGLQVWAHGLYEAARAEPHAGAHRHGEAPATR